MHKAILGGGCFWCLEHVFLGEYGIYKVQSGYAGGRSSHPTYEEVCEGKSGHYEVIQVEYNPEELTFLQLLDLYWRHIDPLDPGGQFADRGPSYQTVIFYFTPEQQAWAEESKRDIQKLFQEPIATLIRAAAPFYAAEPYHHQYCRKQPQHFERYVASHLERLNRVWERKRLLFQNLRDKLTPLQYHVTQEGGTEPPFRNPYWDKKEEGIYVDIISGEPLFSSIHKFDSGSGWPSFTQSLTPLIEKADYKLSTPRTEVKGALSGAHLGHLFQDGPSPTGLRYCMNSAALRFIPKAKLKESGYGFYYSL